MEMLKTKINRAGKSYDNREFLHSSDGRVIRMIAEYLHPLSQFNYYKINKFVTMFGSARFISTEEFEIRMNDIKEKLNHCSENEKDALVKQFLLLEKKQPTCKYYDEAYETSKLIAEWSKSLPQRYQFHICTGGGGGIMEAANRGSYDVGMPSVGLNISLPFEQHPNQYIHPNLNFEFHYFFMRKFWFVYNSLALFAFPGGFGTLDELMELLTLTQTNKLKHKRPIILYSKDFWNNVINFNYLAEIEVISEKDLDLFKFANSPKEALELLKREICKNGIIPEKYCGN
ncbi:MAG TPA: LOG family protein [Candidatus Kapabacteria bacterium]|mgnify:CR=1 FL=1|nr:LOG family protein [Candidatus Kapabacteria bacterium]HPO63234.1 LOG family protein [Candidatus Kapabacteria bacterium]